MLFLASTSVLANNNIYRLEVGLQAGAGYYMGELAPYAFMASAETYGIHTRLKIDNRWAVRIQGQRQRVISTVPVGNEYNFVPGKYQTPMCHVDVVGEFNFFRFGFDTLVYKVKKLTPVMFIGIGFSTIDQDALPINRAYPLVGFEPFAGAAACGYDKCRRDSVTRLHHHYMRPNYAAYIPVGFGLKWRFLPQWQLHLMWQHNLYIANGDCLEGQMKIGSNLYSDAYNNNFRTNGSNVMNNDVTSTLTLGLVFEFALDRGRCVECTQRR